MKTLEIASANPVPAQSKKFFLEDIEMNGTSDNSGRQTALSIGNDARSHTPRSASNRVVRRNRLALAVSLALVALAPELAQAGPGKVCLDGTTAASGAVLACTNGATPIGTYYANSPQLRKFVDTLPGLTPGNFNTFATATGTAAKPGEYIPIAVADTTTYPGSEYFVIGVVEHQQWMHSELQKPTTLRSYVQLYPRLGTGFGQWPDDGTGKPVKATDGLTGQTLPAPVALSYLDGSPIYWPGTTERVYGFDKPHYLGPIILTFTGTPVRTQMVNLLPTGRATSDGLGSVLARNGDIFLPVDESLGGAGVALNGDKYPQNRAAFHLHGGDSPWISDGTPHQWIVPAADPSPYKAGSRVMNVPDMPFPGTGSLNLFWPNDQSSRLMWYHDHTFGLTRQNAYGGEAAGYVIIDGAELALQGGLDGKTASTAINSTTTINKVLPNGLLDQIVLIVQDKTFVPNDIAVQDSKWDTKAWGQPGDLWYPHVYEPFQLWGSKPDDTLDANTITGNPAGRWDYAVNDATLMYLPPTVPLRPDPEYGDVAFPDGSYADGTPGKGPSATPESYMDTSMVNGVAYPTTTVEPKAYRVRFLNGANDRYYNLSLFVADSSVTSSDGRINTEVKMVPELIPSAIAVDIGGTGYVNPQVSIVDKITLRNGTVIDGTGTGATASAAVDSVTGTITAITLNSTGSGYVNPQVVITEAGRVAGPNDAAVTLTTAAGRPEGVPDPASMGPSIVQFGNEAGFLPVPVVHKPGPMLLNAFGEEITGEYFYLGNAERADTVIDFSQYAGKTLIMYNDSTAPVPGGDTRYDYYTGNPDQTTIGGAPSTAPGFGPNTRTVMQFVVGNAVTKPIDYPTVPGAITGTSAYDNSKLKTELSKAYTAVADTHVVGAAAAATDPNLGALPLSVDTAASKLTLADGSIVDMQIKTLHGFTDPNVGRLIAQIGTELPGAIGTPTPLGYIDSPTDIIQAGDTQYWWIKNYDVDNHPMHFHLFNVQVLAHRVIGSGVLRPPEQDEMGWKETVKNWPGEDLIVALRPKTPQLPFGLPKSVRTMDPTLPAGVTANDVLYGHLVKGDITNTYTGTSGATVTTAVPYAFAQIDLNPFERDANGNFVLDTNTGKLTPNANYGVSVATGAAPISNATQDFGWEYVWHCHILGHEENDLMRPMVFIPVVTKSATGPSAVTVSATGTVTWTDPTPAYIDPNAQPPVPKPETKGNTENEIGFRVERAVVTTTGTATPTVGAFTALTPTSPVVDGRVNTLANATSFQDAAPAAYTDYQYKVVLVNEAGEVAATYNLAQAPAAPTTVSVTPAGLVKWTDASTNETGFRVERAPVITDTGSAVVGSFAAVSSVAANATTFQDLPLANVDYQYRVFAVNAAASSTDSAASATASIATAPAAPTVQSIDSATGLVTWIDNASNETSFIVERATVTTSSTGVQTISAFSQIGGTLAANTQTLAGFALAANTDYQYRVTAKNAVGSTVSPIFAYSATVPAAVGSVSVASTGVITWLFSASNGVTGYQINRATVTGGIASTFAPLATVGAVDTYTDVSIVANTDYQYQVVAMKGTAPSIANPVATLAQAPLAATGLTASLVTATTLTLTWVDGSTNEDGFSIEASLNGGAYAALAATPVALNTTTYPVTGLTPGSYYTFRVGATKNLSGYTPTYTTTPVVYTPATLVAPVVTALSSLVGGLPQALVTWTSTSVGQTGFTVERCAGTTATCAATTANWTLMTTVAGSGASLSYLDTTLASGATYVYRVKTLATNTSVVPNVTTSVQGLSAQTSTAVTVVAPTNLTATSPTGVGVTLAWTDSSTNETSFQVFRTPAFAAAVNVTRTTTLKAATGGTVSYVDATAVAGTPYAYYVVAVNTAGTTVSASPASNTANITLAMPAPTGLTAVQSGANLVLTWTDTSASETAFAVLRTDSSGVTTTFTVARTAAQATSVNTAVTYSDVTAIPGTVYTYAVRAVNTPVVAAGVVAVPTYSGYTANVTASVAIPAPTQLSTAVPAAGTGIILNWVDNATFETGYRIDRAIVSLDALGNVPAGTVYTTLVTQARTGNVVRTTGAAAYTDLTATALPVNATTGLAQVYAYQVYAVKTTAVPAPVGGVATTVTSFSAPSNEAHTGAAAVVSGAPIGLTAVTSSGTSIVLSWIDNTAIETAYQVTRTDSAGVVVVTRLAVITGTGRAGTFSDATAAVGVNYTYEVAALVPVTATNPLGKLAATVSAALTLNAPSGATATHTASGITIGWTDNSTNEIGFQIVRTNVDAVTGLTVPVVFNVTSMGTQKSASGTARTYIDTTALPGVTYTYTVAATSGTAALPIPGTAISTNPVTITETIVAPSAPTAVITSATRITVTWTDLSMNETGFKVERLLTPTVAVAGAAAPVWTTLATVARTGTASTGVNTAVSYIDNLVAPVVQGTYQYRVSAVSMTGTVLNAASAAIASNVLDFNLPAAPTALSVTAGAVGSRAVTLGWTDNAANETGFTIQRATNATFTRGLVTTAVPGAVTANPVSYVLSGMTAGTKYFFRVAATNASGTSAYVASTVAVAVP
jgi:FtsP/CotA-like multicopper oxidase with cupredoxin domain